MGRCLRCHRHLKDPHATIGRVCARKLARAGKGQLQMPLRSTFTREVTDGFVLLVDQDRGMSVTNDAENVIADLAAEGLLQGRAVLYRDTDGRWDELGHDGARFTGFRPLGASSRDQAIEMFHAR